MINDKKSAINYKSATVGTLAKRQPTTTAQAGYQICIKPPAETVAVFLTHYTARIHKPSGKQHKIQEGRNRKIGGASFSQHKITKNITVATAH